jgi:hypothetical protein
MKPHDPYKKPYDGRDQYQKDPYPRDDYMKPHDPYKKPHDPYKKPHDGRDLFIKDDVNKNPKTQIYSTDDTSVKNNDNTLSYSLKDYLKGDVPKSQPTKTSIDKDNSEKTSPLKISSKDSPQKIVKTSKDSPQKIVKTSKDSPQKIVKTSKDSSASSMITIPSMLPIAP